MAIAFRAAGTFVSGATTGISPGIPAGTVANDILLLVATVDSGTESWAVPAGWTEVFDVQNVSQTVLFAWRRASGGDSAPSIQTGGTTIKCGQIFGFSGVVTTGDPWDVTPTSRANASSTTATADSLTTTSANNMIVMLVGDSIDSNAAQYSSWACATDPATLTEHGDGHTNTGTGCGLGEADAVRTTAGATGNGTATLATASVTVAFLVALVESHALPENDIKRIEYENPVLDAATTFISHSYQGWQQSPLSADAPPEENQETINRRWTELPSEAYDKLFGHNFQGFQLSPTPDDFFAANVHTHIAIPCYVPVNRDYTFTLTPLSDDAVEDNQETIRRWWFDLPDVAWKYLGHSFDGWLQSPLADDNEEAFYRVATENPTDRFARPLPDQTWTQSPLPDNVEDPLIGTETRLTDLAPWVRDRNLYDGAQTGPLSEDFVEQIALPELGALPPFARDRNLYDGFQAAPLSADFAEPEIQPTVADLPPGARDKNFYDGFQTAPLSDDEPAIAPQALLPDLPPWARDRNLYDGFQSAPLSADAGVDEPLFGASDLSLNLHWTAPDLGYMGFTNGPTSDDVVAPETAIYRPTFRHRRR